MSTPDCGKPQKILHSLTTECKTYKPVVKSATGRRAAPKSFDFKHLWRIRTQKVCQTIFRFLLLNRSEKLLESTA